MMGDMSTDRPTADDTAGQPAEIAAAPPAAPPAGPPPARPAAEAETVEWGAGDRPARPAPRWLAGLREDRRVPAVAVGLGAVALALSVLSEWQVTTLSRAIFGGEEAAER